jgi:hypothetical protein
MEATWFETPIALPPDAQALFADSAARLSVDDFYSSLAWYDLLCRTAGPNKAAHGFLLLRHEGRALAVLPLWRMANNAWHGLTSPYTCLFAPLMASDLDDQLIRQLGCVVAEALRNLRGGDLRLDCLAADWPPLISFCAGLRDGGLVVLRFAHFGNWYSQIDLEGQPALWRFYQTQLGGALRETIRRRTARVQRDGGFRFSMVQGGADLPDAMRAFAVVYAKSWKHAEPHPAFNAEMMALCAAQGRLRLAVLWHRDAAVAVQYWLVSGGVAQVLKLAHLPDYEVFSPGTVLTAWAIAQILDTGSIHTLDFGRGDDDYKQLWVKQRRERIGIIAANPRQRQGLILIIRHAAGRLRRFFSS